MTPRVLVVYFSRSGHTASIAEALRKRLSADVEELHDPADRRGLTGYLRSGAEALLGASAQIERPAKDPSVYDLVLVGAPVWAASACPPARTYLWLERDRLPPTGFFVTYGGAGADRALGQMRALLGKKPVATLAIREADVRGGRAETAVAAFTDALLGRPPRPRKRRRSARARAA